MSKILKVELDKHITKADIAHSTIEGKVDNLRDNHIHHLSLDVGYIKKDMWWIKLIGGFIIAEATGILIALFVK